MSKVDWQNTAIGLAIIAVAALVWAEWCWLTLRRAERNLGELLDRLDEADLNLHMRNLELTEQEHLRWTAEAQLRDTRTALAIERARVDHAVGVTPMPSTARAAAKDARPFPDFGVESAGVRLVDKARRQIERAQAHRNHVEDIATSAP